MVSLIDTNIVVDLLRNHPPAEEWFGNQADIHIPRPVWYEVIRGAQNKRRLTRALVLLRRFEVVELTQTDHLWATEQLIEYTLRYNVDVLDALIAATAYRLQVPLYTRNIKHFYPMIGELAQAPY